MQIIHFSFSFVLLQALLCYHIGYTSRRHLEEQSRSRRSMQHPAFSMIMGSPMSFPGFTMHDSSESETLAECITDDIVCPAYCLMEDEWGCKYCPCGPANGMSPPIISDHHRHTEPKHEEDCIGTLLCMLSCKDGYKLGARDSEHGCQSCTCVKKNKTKTESSTAGSGMNAVGSTHNNKPCAWPLCMNGNGPNNGPGSGASMTSLPIGGVKAGGSLPGVDCIGAACSAKNGMQMMGQVSPLITPAIPSRPLSTPSPWRPTIKMPHTTVKPQKTLLLLPPTKSPKQMYLIPVPTEAPRRSCTALEHCMTNCHYGFQVQNSRRECPDCSCILPRSPPAPTTTSKPDFIAIMRVCPDAVHCMKMCAHGYTLSSSHTESCPICTCNKEPKVLILCEKPMSCPNGCSVGYKGDTIGCPTCNCVSPSETKLQFAVHTTKIDSAFTCSSKFSCVDKCSLGYKTGDNGCPTCVCLVPGTAPSLQIHCEQPLSCPYGCTVGFKCNNEGCPICSCIAPSETTYKTEVQRIVVEKFIHCEAKFSCQQRCEFGFKTGTNGCPSCTCLQPLIVDNGQHVAQTGSNKIPTGYSHVPTIIKVDTGSPRTLTAMEACPESVQCIMGCKGTYKLTQTPGEKCPQCHCTSNGSGCFGPSCSAPGSHNPVLETGTPAPGECVAILHCVMTCESGYDIGEYSRDGCPTCTCIQ